MVPHLKSTTVLLGAAFFLVFCGAAMAEVRTLRDLLADGFEIKGTSFIAADVLQRAIDPSWQDGVLLTLQSGSQVAFCHGTLASTADAATFVELQCTVSIDAVPVSN